MRSCSLFRFSSAETVSNQIQSLYRKKNDTVKDYLHKVTRYLVDYCQENKINRVIIGDIKNIRKGKNLGSLTNQKLHGLPYARIYGMLEYKMRQEGIQL